MLQISIKTAVVFYYHSFDSKTAEANCEYKTITVCKGSCYVTKQIKIVSSSTNKETQNTQQIDLSNVKDIACEEGILSEQNLNEFSTKTHFLNDRPDHYFYNHKAQLIKPPTT